jgi:opacity protein-like surface antigen
MFKYFTIASIFMCAFTVTLQAADAPEGEVPETSSIVSFEETIAAQYNSPASNANQSFNHTSFYVGIDTQLNQFREIAREFDDGDWGGWEADYTFDHLSYALKFGQNYQLNESIIGYEFNYTLNDSTFDGEYWTNDNVVDTDYPVDNKLKNRIDLKGKYGKLIDNNLLYFVGGISFLEIDRTEYAVVGDHINENTSRTYRHNHTGYIIGFGYDMPISDKVALGIEYLHSGYDMQEVDTSELYGAGTTEEYKSGIDTINLGVKYYFN